MPSKQAHLLTPPWDRYFTHIAEVAGEFWEQRPNPAYGRLQSKRTWDLLVDELAQVAHLPGASPLSELEWFLLFASSYLHEVGWQLENAELLTPAERYKASGQEIRRRFSSPEGQSDLGLSILKSQRLIVEALARLCELIGTIVEIEVMDDIDFTQFIPPVMTVYHKQARLGYLAALVRLADLLLTPRGRDWYLRTVPVFAPNDRDDARLALDPYVALVDLTNDPLTVYYSIHAQDQMLAEKMSGLFEEPIKRWWTRNWQWLVCPYHIRLTFHKPVIEIMHPEVPLEPLDKTCPALLNFLDSYNPPSITLPSLEEIEEYCKSREIHLIHRVDIDSAEVNSTKLRKLMLSAYSLPAFRLLCADLGVDYDNLQGETLETRMLYLIEDFKRLRKYATLVNKVLADHPYLAEEL